MRNLKRALSLTLASVMLLGMMVVGSSAAAGYDDVSKTDNVEAIEVLQTIEVMVGDERGFGPERPVNRAEMAVVMGKLLNLDYNYYATSCPFNDVYDWARGWVGACYANKIVSGRGEGIYDPGATVTAVEAASMLMRALGYFQYANDVADGFELATVRQGTIIGIFDGVGSSATEPMTRNQVAQMVLNALQSAVVEPDGNTINLTTPDGTVYTGKVNYVSVTSAKPFAHAISYTQATSVGSQNDGWIVELGERLYDGNLELRDHDLDEFGRPSRTWKFNGAEIGTYAKKELLVKEYNLAVTGREVYDLLGQTTIRDNDLYTYYDGAKNTIVKNDLVRSNTDDLDNTGRGVVTEVYLDNDYNEITIASINTYLAKTDSDYNENSETISMTVYNDFGGITKIVDVEDVPAIKDLTKDEWVLVNWADASTAATDKIVVDMLKPEIMENVAVTQFSRSDKEHSGNYGDTGVRVTEIVTGGNTYKNNANAWYKRTTLYDYNADALVNKTYTVYLDQFGNFIGAELYSGDDQYVFITGYDRPQSNISVSTAKAGAIFTDGTMAAINVNVKDTNDNIDAWQDANKSRAKDYAEWSAGLTDGKPKEEMWYKYTLKNDVYTLTPVDGYTRETNISGVEQIINCSNIRLTNLDTTNTEGFGSGRSYGEDASVYITVDDGVVDTHPQAITEVTGMYTGVQNVKLVYNTNEWVHAVYDTENNFIIAAVVFGEAEGVVNNYAYIRDGVKNEKIDGDGYHYWDVDVIMGGELVTKTIKSKFENSVRPLVKGTVRELILDADGYVTKVKAVPNALNALGVEVADGSAVEADKTFSNFDYLNNPTNPDMDKYNVYDIDIANDSRIGVGGSITVGSNTYRYTDLAIQGKSLHFDAEYDDVGLDYTTDAKAVVHQYINKSWKWTAYPTVEAAWKVLADADGESSTNQTNLKQFSGRIVAVLNSQGVAEWVFFDDMTPVGTPDMNYGDNGDGGGYNLPEGDFNVGNKDNGSNDSAQDVSDIRGVYNSDSQKLYLQFQVPMTSGKVTLRAGIKGSSFMGSSNVKYETFTLNVGSDGWTEVAVVDNYKMELGNFGNVLVAVDVWVVDGSVKISGSGKIESAPDVDMEVPKGSTVTLDKTTGGALALTEEITGEGKVVVAKNTAITGGANIKTTGGIELSDGSTIDQIGNIPVKVTGDATVSGAVNGSAKITVDDGAELTLTAPGNDLPKIEGTGKVVINGSSSDADFAKQLGQEVTARAPQAGQTRETSLKEGPKLSGTGKLEAYSANEAIDHYVASNPNATSVSIYTIKLTEEQAPDDEKMQIEKHFKGNDASTWTDMIGGGTGEAGSGNIATITSQERSLMLMIADSVDMIRITVTVDEGKETEAVYTYIFNNPAAN